MSVSSVHLTGEIAEKVDAYCRRMGLTQGEMFRAALKQFFWSGHQTWSDEELLEALRSYVDEFGAIPSQDGLNETDGYPSASTYERRFGSLAEARAKAGVGQPDKGRGDAVADALKAYEYLRSNPGAEIDDVRRAADASARTARRVAAFRSRRWSE